MCCYVSGIAEVQTMLHRIGQVLYSWTSAEIGWAVLFVLGGVRDMKVGDIEAVAGLQY
jgi:hypothetical protein